MVIIEWLIDNMTWLFSGAGITVLGLLYFAGRSASERVRQRRGGGSSTEGEPGPAGGAARPEGSSTLPDDDAGEPSDPEETRRIHDPRRDHPGIETVRDPDVIARYDEKTRRMMQQAARMQADPVARSAQQLPPRAASGRAGPGCGAVVFLAVSVVVVCSLVAYGLWNGF